MNLARMVDCLDPDLCDQIIDVSWEYSPSKVIKEGGCVVDPIRSNSSAQLIGGLEKLAHEQINEALCTWSNRILSTKNTRSCICQVTEQTLILGERLLVYLSIRKVSSTNGTQIKLRSYCNWGWRCPNALVSQLSTLT